MTQLFRNSSPGALSRKQAVKLEKKRQRERARELAAQGRGSETEIAHVARGELVIPFALQNRRFYRPFTAQLRLTTSRWRCSPSAISRIISIQIPARPSLELAIGFPVCLEAAPLSQGMRHASAASSHTRIFTGP